MIKNTIIVVGADHRGTQLKKEILIFLNKLNIKTIDLNTHDSKVDYPVIAKDVIKYVLERKAHYGILICNTGIGMSITANRFNGIRAALCPNAQYGELAKKHNNANILIFGAGYISTDEAILTIKSFLENKFEKGRHLRRLKMLDE